MTLTSLHAARAAYLWRLQADRDPETGAPSDLRAAFRWLLQLQAGEETVDLLRARAAYVAELHAAHLGPDSEIAELAKLHQDLISHALDQAAGRASAPAMVGRYSDAAHQPAA